MISHDHCHGTPKGTRVPEDQFTKVRPFVNRVQESPTRYFKDSEQDLEDSDSGWDASLRPVARRLGTSEAYYFK